MSEGREIYTKYKEGVEQIKERRERGEKGLERRKKGGNDAVK